MAKDELQQNTKPVTNRKATVGKKTTKKKKKVELHSDLNGMAKPQEYLEYVTFMALPRTMRAEILGVENDTQEAFAKHYKVNKNSLTEWKKKAGFWDDVMTVRKDFFRERSGDVILSLETTCIKEGKGQDVRVYLTYTGEYTEKQEQEHKVHPDLQAALEKIGKVLK